MISSQLTVSLILFSIILAIFITILLIKDKITIKYSLLWYAFALLILLVGLVPDLFSGLSNLFGFQTMSNFLIAFILAVLIFLNVALTVMIASQRRRINTTSQEVALLRKEIDDLKQH